MAVTVSTGYPLFSTWPSRNLQATSTGTLWLCVSEGSPSWQVRFFYSTDDGATWAENTSAMFDLYTGVGGATPWTDAAFFIDADDHAHVAVGYYYTDGSVYNGVVYRRMPSIGPSTSWGAAVDVLAPATGAAVGDLSMVAHREGTGWKAHVFYDRTYNPGSYLARMNITSGGVVTLEAGPTLVLGGGVARGIDFFHTAADPKAVQSSTPHLFLAFAYSTSAYFCKVTYSAGTWTVGTLRSLGAGSTTRAPGAIVFDGTRAIVALSDTTDSTVRWWERDAADTTTTARTASAFASGPDLRGLLYDTDQDVWFLGSYSSTVCAREWVRATDTWQTYTTLEAEAPHASGFASLPRTLSDRILVAYRRNSDDYTRFDSHQLTAAPTAPTWVSPVDFAGADVGAALVLDWAFNDPNTGDTQGKFAVRRQIGAGTLYYWRASDSTWQTTETANVSATTSLTLASSWGSDGDADHKYAVKTWDAGYLEGVYGAELTVVPSVPDLPTITTPADASTHVTSSITVEWTVATQTTYLVELLDAAGTTVLWSSGTQTSTGTRSQAVSYTLANGVSYKARVTTANDEGLVGTADTNSFSVSYTAPATPTLTVTADTPTGAITVAHANPTPTGTQPTVTSCDVFVRCTAGTYPDGDRPVAGNGIRVKTGLTPDVDWIDYAPASGRAYQYMVRAYGDNGTTSDSAWTS